ncbi:hypothetical protein IW262DRAFT_1529391 [Armillaria fumosa]|nr:hypothetical protein IW262DRAFT_1529391 [Armillaria fumosa]
MAVCWPEKACERRGERNQPFTGLNPQRNAIIWLVGVGHHICVTLILLPADFKDPAAKHVWFANQLSDNACASQAILNVDIGRELSEFKEYTRRRCLQITFLFVAYPHNHRFKDPRPADIRGADSALATAILDAAKKEKMNRGSNPPLNKRIKTKKSSPEEGDEVTYHFIGYVRQGLGTRWAQVGPVGCGRRVGSDRLDGRRPAGSEDEDVLLAIVDDMYKKASDEWEYWNSEWRQLERRLDEGWQRAVDPTLLTAAADLFDRRGGQKFAPDFASKHDDTGTSTSWCGPPHTSGRSESYILSKNPWLFMKYY